MDKQLPLLQEELLRGLLGTVLVVILIGVAVTLWYASAGVREDHRSRTRARAKMIYNKEEMRREFE